MFTGIIKGLGEVRAVDDGNGMKHISIDLKNLVDPKLGASIALDGACMTVASLDGSVATFDVIRESLDKTTLGSLNPGDKINIEPPLSLSDELGGHIVQGHVDTTSEILGVKRDGGDVIMEFSAPEKLMKYIAPKGSIAIEGISLTIVEVFENSFTIALIPETLRLTTLGLKKPGDKVNLEVDYLAKLACYSFGPKVMELEKRIKKLEGKD